VASLENYTFLTPQYPMQRTNVYADAKEGILKTFSNSTLRPSNHSISHSVVAA
jgi:hypothetical protein